MFKIIILTAFCFFYACASSAGNKTPKMDAPLRQKIAAVEKSDPGEVIKILGKCHHPINDDIRSQLAASGATIGTVTGNIFTASGTASQIRRLAKMEEVAHLSLSIERKY